MKATKYPETDTFGYDTLVRLTDEFEALIDAARLKLEPFITEQPCALVYYFEVRGEEINNYDCCGDRKCIESAKKEIRKAYGKGTRVTEIWQHNDGDFEEIERCTQCGNPFNEFLTWCDSELDHIESSGPYTAENIKQEAFRINAILQSCPTCDVKFDRTYNTKKELEKDIADVEAFYQIIVELDESVVNLL